MRLETKCFCATGLVVSRAVSRCRGVPKSSSHCSAPALVFRTAENRTGENGTNFDSCGSTACVSTHPDLPRLCKRCNCYLAEQHGVGLAEQWGELDEGEIGAVPAGRRRPAVKSRKLRYGALGSASRTSWARRSTRLSNRAVSRRCY